MRREGTYTARREPPPRSGFTDVVVEAVDPILSLGPDARWRGDDALVTRVSGAVSVWTDMISGRTLIQGTPANRPGYTASNANLNGMPSLDWSDSADRLNSSEAASEWTFLHNGVTGAQVYMVVYHAATTNYDSLFSTRGATSPGVELNIATDRARARNHNGTVLTNADATGYTVGKRWIAARYSQASAGLCRVAAAQSVTGTWTESGTFTPSAAAPSQTLGIKIGVNGLGTPVSVAEIIVFGRVLTAPEHAIVAAALSSRYAL